ncbi:MAG: S9 family peptidase [Acidobacteria bacterium]|nr:S9 family peptidase [Acidobacteriota bacterium]
MNPVPAGLSTPREISYASFDGTPVQGWLYPAVDVPGRAPMILSIHGGPHAQSTAAFNGPVQAQAAAGYAVLVLNPRGSVGYGQKFADGTLNDWGGGDYKDLMAGVDHVLATDPRLDSGRLAVMGASYGGYMTNWVITHTTRFRAAVSSASISNLISFYGTSLYQDLIHAEYGGTPWSGNRFEALWRTSPLAWVAAVKTPTLFLHGEADHDVPITQGEEMYTALRQQGVPAEMVRYPREGHSFSGPRHIDDARRRSLEWLARYLQ